MNGKGNISRLTDFELVFLFVNENMRAVSFETVLLNIHWMDLRTFLIDRLEKGITV